MAAYTFNIDLVFENEVDNGVFGKFDEDLDDVSCDEFTGLQLVDVADGAADQVISLGGLTTAYSLALVSDQVITLKHNGATTVITLRADEPVLLSTITSLTASNGSGSDAKVKYIAAGT